MKKLSLFVAVLLVAMFASYSCNRSEQTPSPDSDLSPSTKIPSVLTNFKLGDLYLPDGTTTSVSNKGATVNFTYPAGIVYVHDYTSNLEETGSYTCTGSCDTGCDVFYVKGSFACSACSNGAACTGKASLKAGEGGFIDRDAGIRFLKNRDEMNALNNSNLQAPKHIIKYAFVREAMIKMNLLVHGVADPTAAIASNPKAYKDVVINLFGTTAVYTVPVTYLEAQATKGARVGSTGATAKYTELYLEDSGFSCKCSSGKTGCTADSGFGYKSCVSGDCDSCTMTVN